MAQSWYPLRAPQGWVAGMLLLAMTCVCSTSGASADSVELAGEVAKMRRAVQQERFYGRDATVTHLTVTKECKRSDQEPREGASGVFIGRTALGTYTAFCDRFAADGGGWIVIQRRMDGSVDFNRGWTDYRQGFGAASGEYWLGLETIHRLTTQPGHPYELRIDMTFAGDGSKHIAKYSRFKIGPERLNYRLEVAGFYSPDLRNSLSYHHGRMFTTKDRDNDAYSRSCSSLYFGGWWYGDCHHSNLNGKYGQSHDNPAGVTWANGAHIPMRFVEMKIRPHRR